MLQTEQETTYATDVGSDVPSEKKTKTKFKVKFQKMLGRDKQKAAVATAAPVEGATDAGELSEDSPQPPTPPKKGKKPKREKGEGKKSSRFIIGLCCGAVLVGVSAAVVLVVVNGGSSVEKQLEKAAGYTSKEQYEKAEEIYSELLAQDTTLVPAYLGYTENFLAQEDEASAITILERGYEATEDITIEAMLHFLKPEEEAEDEEPAGPSRTPIQWQDAALEQMVRRALPELGSGPVTEEDLQHVTTLKIVGGTHVTTGAEADEIIRNLNSAEGYTIDGQLYTERGDIRSLADISHFKNLKKLVVGYNQIDDIGGIEFLTGLETVALYCNNISDIHLLSGLSGIKYLYLYHNQISDISPLANLPELRSVYLQNNLISDLSPLGGNHNLSLLYISDNQVSDISVVSSLGNLSILMAEGNAINDLTPVQNLENLTDVDFTGNPAADYAPTAHIQNVNRTY